MTKKFYFIFSFIDCVGFLMVIIYSYYEYSDNYPLINRINKKSDVFIYIGKIITTELMPIFQMRSIIIDLLSVKILEKIIFNLLTKVDLNKLLLLIWYF